MMSCSALCGNIILTTAAIFSLRILPSFSGFLALVEEAPQLQQIVHTECRPASGDAAEGIFRHHVGHVGQQGLKLAAGVVVENPILAPVQSAGDQLILNTAEWMERMGDPESACGLSRTTCI